MQFHVISEVIPNISVTHKVLTLIEVQFIPEDGNELEAISFCL
jgi:hypothetical protein